MVWRIPAPLIAGLTNQISETITTDTYIGDLYTYLNSPTQRVDVTITVDGADAGEIIITNDFAAGSTFEFIATNGGRILGEGGDGGAGGNDNGATGSAGSAGANGTPAITSAFPVSLDVDAGFIFGGGGGGGGGAYDGSGAGDPGGGGGGGQGWSGGASGAAGSPSGTPVASAGTAGSRLVSGSGGSGAATVDNRGGDGGTFGLGGRVGTITDIMTGGNNTASLFLTGGRGGTAGEAFKGTLGGATVTFTGAKTEATLRSEGRILGETSLSRLFVPSTFITFGLVDMGESNVGIGVALTEDGNLERKIDSSLTRLETTTQWNTGVSAGIGASYEVRASNVTEGSDVTGGTSWLSRPTPGTWTSLASDVPFYLSATYPNFESGVHLVELRRDDIPGVGADDVMASFYIQINFESTL